MPLKEYTAVPTNPKCPDAVQAWPLSEILDKASCLANETLDMARRLNGYLFNQNIPDNETDPPVMCFSDALGYQVETLKKIHAELEMICKSCGAVQEG